MSHDSMLSCIIRIKKRVIATALTIQNVFESTGSQLTFAGYRFSDKNFVTMNEYINDTNHYTNYQLKRKSHCHV
ncbi:fimbria/pilus outer membrane usher protein [Escherichia coli]